MVVVFGYGGVCRLLINVGGGDGFVDDGVQNGTFCYPVDLHVF